MLRTGKAALLLRLFLLLTLSVILYHSTIFLFPSFIHAWTQSDRYAIALRFLDNGFGLFHPATFNLQTVDGITRVDFPVNEFIVAIFMKVFGTSPAVFRVYTLLVSIVGLMFLYKLSFKITNSAIKSWLVMLFVFLSPVYTYYQAGFIPSIPAIASVFAGYFYFFSYKEDKDKRKFLTAVILFLLAALIRLPFVIFLLAVFLQQAFPVVKSYLIPVSSPKEKGAKRFEVLLFVLAFLVFGSYYLYNVHLGRLYGNMFLDSFLPAKSFSEFGEILFEMYDHWSFHYFTLWHYLLLFVLLLISLFTFLKRKNFREEDKRYWFQFLIISCGTALYFLIMTRQFYAHDYYFLDSFFIPVVLLLLFALKNLSVETRKERITWGSIFGISVLLFLFSDMKTQAERYTTGSWDRVEITRQNFTGSAAYLDSIGVPKDAKILVIDAYTTNAPLILMNRKGYTVMGTTAKNIGTALQWCKWDLVAIQDVYLVSDVIRYYPQITSMLECAGSTGTVSFYKKSQALQPKTLRQFLGISPSRILFEQQVGNAKDTAHKIMQLDSLTEYGATADVKAAELKSTKGLKILVNADFAAASSLKDIQLVAAVSNGTGQVYYQNFALGDYFKASPYMQKMEFQFVLPELNSADDELKVYLWNPGKVNMRYARWEVIVYK